MGKEEVLDMLLASITFEMYCKIDQWVHHMVCHISFVNELSVGYVRGA